MRAIRNAINFAKREPLGTIIIAFSFVCLVAWFRWLIHAIATMVR